MKNKKIILLFVSALTFACSKDNSDESVKVNKLETVTSNQSENQTSEVSGSLKSISPQHVKSHVGDSLIVKTFVADIFMNDKVAYLNFENKFPKNVFSAAIFANKFDEFGDLAKYKNKYVEVTGRISTYKNKPQIILHSKDQIKIIK